MNTITSGGQRQLTGMRERIFCRQQTMESIGAGVTEYWARGPGQAGVGGKALVCIV